jgi:hypothetical protein
VVSFTLLPLYQNVKEPSGIHLIDTGFYIRVVKMTSVWGCPVFIIISPSDDENGDGLRNTRPRIHIHTPDRPGRLHIVTTVLTSLRREVSCDVTYSSFTRDVI